MSAMATSDAAALAVEGLSAGYGDIQVLRDIAFAVPKGRMVAVLGANGAGKTTLLSAIAGLLPARGGRVRLYGDDVTGRSAVQMAARGLALVPEGGRLFPFMSVEDNLELGAYLPSARAGAAERAEEMMALFPILKERRRQLAGRLSGGERQMCAIARALMSRPTLLMLDEPSAGLSPLMAARVLETIAGLVAGTGLTAIVVEQRVTEILAIADEAHVLDHGRLVKSGLARDLRDDPQVRETYMGL
jgi:branched-chain amino acid transport system ATP-binding protein